MSGGKTIKYLDLFAGYGGFSLGIQQVINAECIGFSEIDRFAIETYQKHFPEHKNYGDITKINPEELPDFDLLVGGFPCQAFSIAGKRRGFSETRGTLIFDVLRILEAKRPARVLLENVKGLLSHDGGRTFRTIITSLAELGYSVEWQVLNAKNFGVPQNRERVFIVGHLGGFGGRQVFPLGADGAVHPEQESSQSPCLKSPLRIQSDKAMIEITRNVSDAQRIYSPKGISKTLKGLGGGQGAKTGLYEIPEATKKGFAVAEEGDSINLSVINSKTRRGRVGKGIAQTLDTGMHQHTIDKTRIRRLTPTECERLMGLPDGWTAGHSDTQRYKLCGNGVVVDVVREVIRKMYA